MRYLALAVLMLPLLTACGEPEVKEPTTSATPSSSPSPTLTPPTIPAQAKEDSPEGAAAFVRHWVGVFNLAARTGRTDELERLGTNCTGCNSYISSIGSLGADKRPSRSIWALESLAVEKVRNGYRVKARVSTRSAKHAERIEQFGFTLVRRAEFRVSQLVRVVS